MAATRGTPAKKAVAKQAPVKKAAAAKKAAPAKKAPPAKKAAPAAKKAAPASAKKAAPASAKKAAATTKAAAKQAPAKKAVAAKKTAAAPKAMPVTSAAPVRLGSPAAPPVAKKPAKSPFDAKFLDQQREALVAARDERLRQSELLYAEAVSLTENREPGDVQFDEESGEGDTLAVERERDLALSAQALAEVEEIDAALERIVEGTYGLCRVSGLAIPKERLKAIPWATERVEFKVGGFGRR